MATQSKQYAESTSRTQTQTLTIPNLVSVSSVTVNTGSVTYTRNGNVLTFTLSGGAVSNTVQTGGSPADTKYVSSCYAVTLSGYWIYNSSFGWYNSYTTEPSSFKQYYNSGGYTGTLDYKSGGGCGGYDPSTYNPPIPSSPGTQGQKIPMTETYRGEWGGNVSKPDTRTYQNYYQYTVTVQYIDNISPTLTLTSPSDIFSLSQGTSYTLQGTFTDPNNGNVLTAKYKINNSLPRALHSAISDGSTPITFAKTLTYSNKRLWDGVTDIIGSDLVENKDHTLIVWSEDDQGGKSAESVRTFRVVWNRPPVISGENEDLGKIQEAPSILYSVTEPENDSLTITEKINNIVIRSYQGVAAREETITIPHEKWIELDLDTPHLLTVEASDSEGLTSTRSFTFTRTETHIEFQLNLDSLDVGGHFVLDGMPQRVLITLDHYIPEGASIESVKVCNNALDEEPTWEDATNAVKNNRGYLFTNKTKTAPSWAINIWVLIAKGTATERVKLNGFGGAFD